MLREDVALPHESTGTERAYKNRTISKFVRVDRMATCESNATDLNPAIQPGPCGYRENHQRNEPFCTLALRTPVGAVQR